MKKTDISVYEILRDRIINLDYEPGQELNVNELINELGVSRSPVRDALLHLSLDKLIDIFPQKGTRVSLLDVKIINQERFMRKNLELGVLKMFMNSLNESKRQIAGTKLKAILLQQNASLMANDKKEFLKYDDELHHFFYEETDNQWLWDVVSSHTGNDHRIRMLSFSAEKIRDNVENEHKELVDAIINGNTEKALKINEQHLVELSKVIEPLSKEFSGFFSSGGFNNL